MPRLIYTIKFFWQIENRLARSMPLTISLRRVYYFIIKIELSATFMEIGRLQLINKVRKIVPSPVYNTGQSNKLMHSSKNLWILL